MINKIQIIQEFTQDPKNTGDSFVQVALFTSRINLLTEHLKIHNKDHSSRRSLLKLVHLRKSMLQYIKHKNFEDYKNLIARLGIRK